MAESKYHQFKLYKVSFPDEYVLHVQFDRPRNLNAVNPESYRQYRQIFEIAEHDPDVRVIVLSGVGRAFCAGLDVEGAQQMFSKAEDVSDVSRRGLYLYRALKEFQRAINKPFEINKPVIAVAHGPSIGLAVDILSAVDIRFASKDAQLSIKEIDIGMAADIGTLQRLPKIVKSLGWLKEIAYTGRIFGPQEAMEQGLIDKVFDTKSEAVYAAVAIAKVIAEKSPVAIHGTKKAINYALDHTLQEGLEQIAEFNAHGLGTDFLQGLMAATQKQKPRYEKL